MRLKPLLVVPLLALLLSMPLGQASAAPVGQWTPTTSYPLQVAGESCVVYSDNVYCLGGFDFKGNDYHNAYYAPLSSTGVGAWTSTTPYPASVDSTSCALSNAVVYCVGGENSTSVLSNVYDAKVTPSGFGAWSQAGAYPQTIASTSCFAYSGYIYCVGGFDSTGDETASAYYASLSSGLSSWIGTTAYPYAVDNAACVVQTNYVYCMAGTEESGLPQYPIADAYYAELSSSGIGPWTAAAAQYPDALSGLSCVLNSGYIYCAGGYDLKLLSSEHVYAGQVTGSGVTSWTNSTAYPFRFDDSSCVTDLSNIYCIAGRTSTGGPVAMSDDDYFAPLAAAGASTSNSTASTTTSSASSSTPSTSSSSATTSTSSTTSTVPEFNGGALILTTIVALSAVGVVFRVRAGRRTVRGVQPAA